MIAALEEFKMTMDEIQSHWMRSKNEENWTPTLQYLNGASGILCHLPDRSGSDYSDALDDIYLLRRVIHNRCKLKRETEEAAKLRQGSERLLNGDPDLDEAIRKMTST